MGRRNGEAHARGDEQLVAVEIKFRGKTFQDSLCDLGHDQRIAAILKNKNKFVLARPIDTHSI